MGRRTLFWIVVLALSTPVLGVAVSSSVDLSVTDVVLTFPADRLSPDGDVPTGSTTAGDIVAGIARLRVSCDDCTAGACTPSDFPEQLTVTVSWRRIDSTSICGFSVMEVPLADAQNPDGVPFLIDTTEMATGTYEISVAVASGAITHDCNATNDLRAADVYLRVRAPKPELHFTQLLASPPSPITLGETIRVSATLVNTGELGAGPSVVTFTLRAIAECEDACTLGTLSASVPGLPVGATRLVERSFSTDSLVAELPKAGVCCGSTLIDALRLQIEVSVKIEEPSQPAPPSEPAAWSEEDPRNNTIVGFATISESKMRKPDLQPVRVELSRETPLTYNESATVRVRVVNNGGRTATDVPVAIYLRAVLDDSSREEAWEEIASYEISELGVQEGENAHTRTNLRIPPQLPGEYQVRIVVDPPGQTEETANGKVVEQNERNNETVIGFSVVGPQLRPLGLDVDDVILYEGERASVHGEVTNVGQMSASSFAVGFFIDGERVGDFQSSEPLARGEVLHIERQLDTRSLSAGVYRLRLVVDPENQWPEADETDNEMTATLEILGPEPRRAELHPIAAEFLTPSAIQQGTILPLELKIRNTGDIDATPFRVRLLAVTTGPDQPARPEVNEGAVVWTDTFEVPGLAVGRTETVVREIPVGVLPQGAYWLAIQIDPENVVDERDDDNNALYVGLTVGDVQFQPRGKNLSCRIQSVRPAGTVDPGDTVEITSAVTNVGVEPIGPFRVGLSWRDPFGSVYLRETHAVDALDPGQSVLLPYSVDTTGFPMGIHQAIADVDIDGVIEEENETDNQCASAIPIGTTTDPLPDLVPVAVRFDSPGFAVGAENTVERNQPLYAYVTVRNNGVIPTGSFTIAFSTSQSVDIVTWNGIGPLDQAEVSHRLPTGTSGTFELSITIDPDALIWERNESNNSIPNDFVTATPRYSVATTESARPERIDDASSASGPVRWIGADPVTLTVYAVSVDGLIRSIAANDQVETVASVTGSVVDVDWVFGGTPYALVGTTTGTSGGLSRVDLRTGDVSSRAALSSPVVAVAPAGSQKAYVAVDGGFHELVLSGFEYTVSRLVEVPGNVKEILYDADRATTYVLSTSGIHAYGADLASWCVLDAAELAGAPSVLALAGTGIYIGVEAAGRGTLHAASHCTVTGHAGGHILPGWRFPRSIGDPPIDAITSIVIDPRDVDPVYVSTATGSLFSLGFDGSPQWSYDAGTAIRSTPWADQRTGRIFFGDDAGTPHVLTLSGSKAFDIDLSDYGPSPIRSTLAMLETRARTEFGTRLVRNYYFGTEDGAVYKIASLQ